MLMDNTLHSYLADINEEADDYFFRLVKQFAESIFDKFNETDSEFSDISEKETFICGFKLSLRFMFETTDGSTPCVWNA